MKVIPYFQKHYGFARRVVVAMLNSKSVFVNGKLVDSYNHELHKDEKLSFIHPETKEKVVVKIGFKSGKPTGMLLFHKPKGYVVSKNDPHNKTIYEILPKKFKNYYYIGRLDKDSRGLLLLTSDSRLVDQYESPKNNVKKKYEVEIDKSLTRKSITLMTTGLYADGHGNRSEQGKSGAQLLKALEVKSTKVKGRNYAIITLTEGKKRHIRRMLRALGYKVKDLVRVAEGSFHLDNLPEGKRILKKIKNK